MSRPSRLWKPGPPRCLNEVLAPFLRTERGLLDEDTTDESLRGLKRRDCASCATYEGSGHILSDTESEGAAPCSVAESLRTGGDDAEVGPENGSQQGQWAHHARQTSGSTFDELMRRRSSSTSNLMGGDTLARRRRRGRRQAQLSRRQAQWRGGLPPLCEAAFVNTCMVQTHIVMQYLPYDGCAWPASDFP